jgi:hypothetical protein
MCECQPDIAMFSEFEPPLFRRYDLSVEFLRRRRRARDLIAERWTNLRQKDDDEVLAEIVEQCRIEPLRLVRDHERLVVEPSGRCETGQSCYFFRKFIPYAGDVELWDLSPAPDLEMRAEGAVSYLEYVTGVLDVDERSAIRHLNGQVRNADRIIALQEGRIRLFNQTLRKTVMRELAKLRCLNPLWWAAHPVGSA